MDWVQGSAEFVTVLTRFANDIQISFMDLRGRDLERSGSAVGGSGIYAY